jgi:phospholipid/cholesterol/gamma-HCH transport system substrate-binding protein
MRINTLELSVGFFVLLGCAAMLFLAVQVSGVNVKYDAAEQYQITAQFNNVSGLSERAKVTIAGVTVGRVRSITIDDMVYKANVVISLDKKVNYLPIDTIASIQTAGILGEKFISLSLGSDEELLKEGDVITDTQSSLIIEELIGKFLSKVMK